MTDLPDKARIVQLAFGEGIHLLEGKIISHIIFEWQSARGEALRVKLYCTDKM